jgi:SAM-dependent methyltransferase
MARRAPSAGRIAGRRKLPRDLLDGNDRALRRNGAVDEIARVLRPGGRAIVGVPNRYDPFLRPLFATVLQAIGLYGYGYEKSYSRRALKQMLEKAGLDVVAETAILFIPGWLRMLDLACHTWCRPLAVVTAAMVWPFMFVDRQVPAVRKHGYLLATVVMKPERGR